MKGKDMVTTYKVAQQKVRIYTHDTNPDFYQVRLKSEPCEKFDYSRDFKDFFEFNKYFKEKYLKEKNEEK